MNIETVSELAEQIADWIGIYGGCKSTGDEGCEWDEKKPFCCRQGFVSDIEDRIKAAVENDRKLELIKGSASNNNSNQ
jgi:hypothetical protein